MRVGPNASSRALREGLTAAEVAERVRRGETNQITLEPSRTVADIVRANVLTRFNFLLGSLLGVILVVGPIQDALFGLVIISNTTIGIVQELRAKRTLDRLALLGAPRASVVREGVRMELPIEDVVLDDLVELGPGDQVVADGMVVAAEGLEVDESLVTGEADPVAKHHGDELLSGSFVAAGSGRFRAVRVGPDSYANTLAREARRFTLARSELRAGIDRFIGIVAWLILPTAFLLLLTQLRTAVSIREAVSGSVAGVVAMVPEGLVLLTSIAFAVGVVRLGQRHVLVQELPAVETLARVDVICFDKTGTLTEGILTVEEVRPVGTPEGVEAALGALAAADPHPNATLAAIARAHPPPVAWAAHATVPFSSVRRWAGASFGEFGTWLLGAPDALIAAPGSGDRLLADAQRTAGKGRRVLLLAESSRLEGDNLPGRIEPRALVVLGEQLRADAARTLGYFAEQGVAVKVISGDNPATVGSIAGRLGVEGADLPVDGRDLPEDPGDLVELIDERTVFGRVSPQQKRSMVRALQHRGHVVAMTGDGVNDVLALKEADIGIAMGSGSSAARSVAQLVLLDGEFDSIPPVVAEGRRVIANIERVANLFLTKTVYAMLLAIAVGVAGFPFPFLPRHLTLVGSLTIGIPAFFLALEPNARRARPGFVRRVLLFAVPAGVVAGLATFTAYALTLEVDTSLTQARTVATITLLGAGLLILRALAMPLNRRRRLLLGAMALAFLAVLATPYLRWFFALEFPPPIVWLAAIGVVALTGLVIEWAAWLSTQWSRLRTT